MIMVARIDLWYDPRDLELRSSSSVRPAASGGSDPGTPTPTATALHFLLSGPATSSDVVVRALTTDGETACRALRWLRDTGASELNFFESIRSDQNRRTKE